MYNQDILEAIMQKYPAEQVKIFCKIESLKNSILADNSKKQSGLCASWVEFSNDAEWWENKYNELLNNI